MLKISELSGVRTDEKAPAASGIIRAYISSLP